MNKGNPQNNGVNKRLLDIPDTADLPKAQARLGIESAYTKALATFLFLPSFPFSPTTQPEIRRIKNQGFAAPALSDSQSIYMYTLNVWIYLYTIITQPRTKTRSKKKNNTQPRPLPLFFFFDRNFIHTHTHTHTHKKNGKRTLEESRRPYII